MERRHFLKLAFGIAAGTAAFAAASSAAPLVLQPLAETAQLPRAGDAQPAVTSAEEAGHLQPEQVRWGHGHGHHWGRGHHWGWRHRHWGWHHRRHWGWRHHWHRHRHHHWRHW